MYNNSRGDCMENLNIVDYIVLGIILLFAIIFFFKGFIKSLFSLTKKVLAIFLSFLLVKPVSGILLGTSLGDSARSSVLDWVVSKLGDVANITNPTSEQIGELSSSLNIPKFICDWIFQGFENNLADCTLGEAISKTITYYAFNILTFIALFIILSILIWIVVKVLNKVVETPLLKPINRLLGFALGAVYGALIVSVIFLGMSALSSWDFINNIIQTYIDPLNESFGVARFLYNNNLLVLIYENIINIENIFG